MTTPLLLFSGRRAFSGALDPYATNIGHVYDISRRWLSSYTGNLVRLRRSSDDAQADFGPAPGSTTGELDTAAIAAWLGGATGYVVTIYNQTGGGNVTQAVAANQPTYTPNAINGHSCPLSAGSHYLYTGGAWSSGQINQPYQMFAAVHIASGRENDNNTYYMTDGEDDARQFRIIKHSAYTPDKLLAWFGGYGGVGVSIPGSLTLLLSALANGATTVIRRNGAAYETTNCGTHPVRGLAIGALRAGGSGWWGYLMTIVICNTQIADASRNAIEAALNSWWSIY